jgi:hypothetical protein
VKSEQRNSDDEDDEAHASQAEHNGEFWSYLCCLYRIIFWA